MDRVDDRHQGLVWRTCPIRDLPQDLGTLGLPASDHARAASVADPAARRRFLGGRAVLRATITELCPDLDGRTVTIAVAPTGRPSIAERADLHVSVSHTRGLAAAAVSTGGPVGIDVEPLERTALPPGRAWLTRGEQARLAAHPPSEQHRQLLRLWVAKEATLKAHDTRITRRGIAIRTDRGYAVEVVEPEPDGAVVALLRWEAIAHRFVLAIATLPGRPMRAGPSAL